MNIGFDFHQLLDVKWILGPLVIHVFLAAVLRNWLYPYVADRCIWIAVTSSIVIFWSNVMGWSPSGLEGSPESVVLYLPMLANQMKWFIVFQWFLAFYFLGTYVFAHKRSRRGGLLLRKLISPALLYLFYINGMSPKIVVTGCYLILRIMMVDLIVDFYYLIESFRDMTYTEDEHGRGSFDRRYTWIMRAMFPIASIAWSSTVVYGLYEFFLIHGDAGASFLSISINKLILGCILVTSAFVNLFSLFPIRFI